MNRHNHDVIVVGGGPGGSTAASLIAKDGHDVLLLEKERFPRYQIGESLLPSTVHGVCAMLGVRDEVQRAGFMPKYGGSFKWGKNPEMWRFQFAVSRRMAGPTSHAYQVERRKFDDILLNNAERLGVTVKQGHTVLGVTRNRNRINGVRYKDQNGEEFKATARFVVDASGNGSRLYPETGGDRVYMPYFRNLALFGYFKGGKRQPEPNTGDIMSVTFPRGWFWYIPLGDELTSVGAVVQRELAPESNKDRREALNKLIQECPIIADYLADAVPARDVPYDQIRIRMDYSYDQTVLWSPGLVLIGDAACFIDPVFSSGVHLTTYSGLLAARSINTVLAEDMEESISFREFERRYRNEFRVFHDFLLGFYDMHEDENSYFWQARKITGIGENDQEAFANLVGGVSSGDFTRDAAEASRTLGETTSHTDTSGNVDHFFDTPALAAVVTESSNLQRSGMLGAAAGEEPPMFDDGLTPSLDGRRWVTPVS